MKVKLLKKVRKRYNICIEEYNGEPCRFNVCDSEREFPYNAKNPIYTQFFTNENKEEVFRRCLDTILSNVIDEWKLKLRPDKEYKVWYNKRW